MPESAPVYTFSPRDQDAVLFDLDGVLTRTSRVHATAWKSLFDDFLRRRSAETGEPFVPFDVETDYRRYVDGKPRFAGIVDFLASRRIALPPGSPTDPPDKSTGHGLASRKDELFLRRLEQDGVEVYEDAVALVRALRAQKIATAVVSSSRNCAAVLEAAGLTTLFDARVDGLELERLSLPGKPAPDAFREAARRLGARPSRAVVIEDAIAGIEAGRAGGFGRVVGVDRGGQSFALRRAGADVVVTSLAQIRLGLEPPSAWELVFDGFDPAREGVREALCALGNGYVVVRGATPESTADGVHYPGVYLAGGYDRLASEVDGRTVVNEDLVNLPNPFALSFRLGAGEWFDERKVTILSYRQQLDLRRGLLRRTVRFEDREGRRTTLEERRLVSMDDMHLAALELSLTAESWSGSVTLRTGIEGRVLNTGARLYSRFDPRHLVPVAGEILGADAACLQVRTRGTNLHVAEAARTRVFLEDEPVDAPRRAELEPGYVAQELTVEVPQGATLRVEKIASLFTSRDHAISEPGHEARRALTRAGTFPALLARHEGAWKHLWRRFDIRLDPPDPGGLNVLGLLRLNTLHLLQTASTHSIGLDVGIPARGWTGEAYQGHVFWDELFIFPSLNQRVPEIARSLLTYRYRRLREARAAARAAGYAGAMFPWQSGSNGEEVTQLRNLNQRSGRWMADNTHLQRHVGSAIAWNVWQYFQVTHDLEFLELHGAELILDIARFWSSIAHLDDARGRYVIHGVMGPDEFHDALPGAVEPGLPNNAYTNVLAAWTLRRGLEVLELLSRIRRLELLERLGLSHQELARWEDITHRMFIPFHDGGIISQFEGYEALRELDWDDYRKRYGDIQRLDLILEAEGNTANRYKASKQPDVLMLFYLFSAEELGDLFARLGYPLDRDAIPRNVAYYARRTSHGSTLSRVVLAWVLARSDRPRALRFFAEALQSDVADIQGGTTAEGVHLGAMAGTVDLVGRVSTGIEVTADVLRLNPRLPEELERLDLRFRHRGHALELRLTRDTLTIVERERGPSPIRVEVRGDVREISAGEALRFAVP